MRTIHLEEALHRHFNYDSFRQGQKEIISDVLRGEDVLGVLPTGSGKSICYQLPAKLLDGITIVVSPLISLMIDQVKELKAASFKEVIALNSFLPFQEQQRALNNLHAYRLIYVSPEWLQKRTHQNYLKQLPIKLFVVDEAHCISQWGHEFRPDYQRLHEVIAALDHPPVLALSATATPDVQEDIIQSLYKPEMKKHIYPMDRENIAFYVEEMENDQEKLDRIAEMTKSYFVPTLIYFTSRQASEEIALSLSAKLPNRNIAYYHGGMEASERLRIQQQFMNNQIDIICCTSAFGMGINKPDIRMVIHYHLPLQLESYIQEVGRAGRDGQSSVGVILYQKGDFRLSARMVENELPTMEEIDRVITMILTNQRHHMELPSPEQLHMMADINEGAGRFIQRQLQKHELICDNEWFIDERKWNQVRDSVMKYLEKRQLYKNSKLNELYQWIQTKDCLRKTLYQSFQDNFKEAPDQCCSNCGFDWSKWIPESSLKNTEAAYPLDWRKKLQKILHLEEA
ncbi:RecQ family ATP-dependent DNA helicase [Oceanobacillus jeddahense]|uniref:RecQ family ATP-dependent DNA helicase n=1 Tax=Oceanobacillus jeddahense TaxID=1462527 RepID=A0ABY5JPD1_9BACI|nr:RecQ family ATP-dependent DNA helicase [Oceanobacillus jeddahense]UUI00941.1 RecQ family ATP-dependent DNA helicase [Oceanobacillus jeddahense]